MFNEKSVVAITDDYGHEYLRVFFPRALSFLVKTGKESKKEIAENIKKATEELLKIREYNEIELAIVLNALMFIANDYFGSVLKDGWKFMYTNVYQEQELENHFFSDLDKSIFAGKQKCRELVFYR